MSSYKYRSRYGSGRKRREIIATEEMKKLVPTSKIYINGERDMILVYNGSDKPAKGAFKSEDIIATVNGLSQKVIELFKREFERRECNSEEVVTEWCGLLSDQILEQMDSGEDEEEKKSYYIHKYSTGVPLIESVIIGDQPFFIQMKEGSDSDFNLLSEYPLVDRVLKPRNIHSYIHHNCAYIFESEEEIRYYLRLARKLTPNRNFDVIFGLLKTLLKQYSVLPDHHITFLVASGIYS